MKEQIKSHEAKMQKTLDVLSKELAAVRAGRANPAVLDKITVEYYGAPTPLNQVAAISTPDPRTLAIQPWDGSVLKAIEKAIQVSDLGINPQNDGKQIRLNFPPLTEERSDIGGGGFVALLHEIGRKTCRKRDKQGGNRLGLFTRKKKDNAPENRPVPRHIAVIMDGNGRWAKKRGLPRKAGHKVGAETFRTIATYCKDIGVQYFTVYAFSTENWKRPQDEVDALMNLFRSYLKEAAETMFERGVAVRVLGDLTVLPEDIRAQIAEVDEIADRLGPDAATASLCINYGGRDEIKNAVRAIAQRVKNGELAPEDITEDTITANLYTAHMPDPDLIIRPSGEIRTSNFLLWQSAYSEYYFTDVLWPDFKTTDLDAAIDNFNNRNRRFGGV